MEGIAQDSIVMNLDDVACVGAIDNIVFPLQLEEIKIKFLEKLFPKLYLVLTRFYLIIEVMV
ncbi:MAG: hypothetical protein CM15mP102_17240 [Flavobacteriales bacterium]|nr:MAG: hypothetical protein CM15mP102_17240 [Flavobacteriales bacterium]